MPYALQDRANILRLLQNIRLAGLEPSHWQTVLEQISTGMGGICAHMFGYDSAFNDSDVAFFSGYDPAAIQLYDKHFTASNSWAPGFSAQSVGKVVPSQSMLSDEALRKTEFYNEWVVPQEDIALGGGAILERDGSRHFLIGANVRRKDGLEKQEQWLGLLNEVLPFLRASLEMNRLLNGLKLEAHLLRQGVDATKAAVILLDSIGRIAFCNELAEEMIDEGELLQSDILGRLQFPAHSAMQGLAHVRHANPWLSHNRIPVLDRNGRALEARAVVLGDEVLEMLPFWVSGFISLPLTVLTLAPGQALASAEKVALSLDLTLAQAEVACELAAGKTLAEIAEGRGTTVTTVRNQIQAAMVRTDTRRQVELALVVDRVIRGS